MGTALVYHEDMTATRLLWDDPECEIERPERLTAALDRLRQRGLEQRCLRLSAREASKEELGLVHRVPFTVHAWPQGLDCSWWMLCSRELCKMGLPW
ncbi:PREDICTED: histone deacetylase 10-like [Mandrillus leucophaeus]|uniref:Histone deacetylase domain-containing protein n=2 Tax=Cercopithecidae TaxID=9527 RepID=A0A2K5ZHH9_MANLE|nr:PREDICTED: histone deacetylase 10-like [Mandrillus leucophaeus]